MPAPSSKIKVVRKHNRAGLKLDTTNSSKFNSYGNAAANEKSGRNTACNNSCCFGRFVSKLFGGGGGDGGCISIHNSTDQQQQ